MARYYFDVTNGTGFTEDEEGQELSGVPEARDVAIDGVRSILREDVTNGYIDLAGRIDVSDAGRRPLFSMPFGEAVELRGLPLLRDTH